MGLALNFKLKKIYFLLRSFEGSLLYQACMANDEGVSFCNKNSEEPEMIASLSEDGLGHRYINSLQNQRKCQNNFKEKIKPAFPLWHAGHMPRAQKIWGRKELEDEEKRKN
ncbi:hypothetical protein TNCV_2852281 [Trichonephila clavipes]|nr:hypothetical protein TNCV_2852281 [Trichonephila clavipes]